MKEANEAFGELKDTNKGRIFLWKKLLMKHNGKAREIGEPVGFIKVIVDAKTEKSSEQRCQCAIAH